MYNFACILVDIILGNDMKMRQLEAVVGEGAPSPTLPLVHMLT